MIILESGWMVYVLRYNFHKKMTGGKGVTITSDMLR